MADPTLPPDDAAEKRRAYQREYNRRWREKNKEKLRIQGRETARRRRAADPGYGARLRAANREKYLAAEARKRAAHPERKKDYNRRYIDKDPVRVRALRREAQRRRRAENPEQVREENRVQRGRHGDRNRAYTTAYKKANRARATAWERSRYARKMRAMPWWVSTEEMHVIYRDCPDGMEVDHIVPLKGITVEGYRISGLHVPWNLQYLTPHENHRKHNRMRPEDHAAVGAPVIPCPRQLSLFDE